MSVSLQYQALRAEPLSSSEMDGVKRIVEEAGDPPLEEEDDPWEPFSIYLLERPGYRPDDGAEILAGSIKVFDDAQVEHWLEVLSRMRRLIHTEWSVSLDGQVFFPWDEDLQSYSIPD